MGYEIKKQNGKELKAYWDMAIGLQKVDDLEVSDYLLKLRKKNENDELTTYDIEKLLFKHYGHMPDTIQKRRKQEADIVAGRITSLMNAKNEINFYLSQEFYQKIHEYLFKDIYDHAGKIRPYDFIKKEIILNNDTVEYVNFFNINTLYRKIFNEENKKNYNEFTKSQIVKNITNFTRDIWKVHCFCEGNTRTTAVFIELYLNKIGFNVNNKEFEENSKYFRNALVRASYENKKNKIKADTTFLNRFYINLLYNGDYKLKKINLKIPTNKNKLKP